MTSSEQGPLETGSLYVLLERIHRSHGARCRLAISNRLCVVFIKRCGPRRLLQLLYQLAGIRTNPTHIFLDQAVRLERGGPARKCSKVSGGAISPRGECSSPRQLSKAGKAALTISSSRHTSERRERRRSLSRIISVKSSAGRISKGPAFTPGCFDINWMAWFRSLASSTRIPPNCSFVSA